MSLRTLRVHLPHETDRSYDIIIGFDLLARAGDITAEKIAPCRCVVVTDENVAPLYLKRLEEAFARAKFDVRESVVLPAGETTKSWAWLQKLSDSLGQRCADRKTLIVALGGGVIGDLAGFASSIFMRGVAFIQVPTTLLAQVDSAVGGKTGIDTPFGKNTIGAFHQPRFVLADVATLTSLDRRQLLAGYAEIVKYGLIMDASFFAWCDGNGIALIRGQADRQIEAIEKSCAFKAQIVMEDEREGGRRALLNLGHTFGHALENATGFSDALLHGEAVAIGTVMAFELSVAMGLCPASEAQRVIAHFSRIGLPVKPPALSLNPDALMDFMARDKKAETGALTLVLASKIGDCFVAKDVDPSFVRAEWTKHFH